jgi:hypothetical protein
LDRAIEVRIQLDADITQRSWQFDGDARRVLVELGEGQPARWIQVGTTSNYLGLASDACLVALDVEVHREPPEPDLDQGDDWGTDWVDMNDPGSMQREHDRAMRDFFAQRASQVDAFAADPPWLPLGPIPEPDLPVSMTTEQSHEGDGSLAGLTLSWSAPFDVDAPVDPRIQPSLQVTTSMQAPLPFEDGLPDEFHPRVNEALNLIVMSSGNSEDEPATPGEAEQQFHARTKAAKKLSDEAKRESIAVPGGFADADVIRTDTGFVAWLEHDGAHVTVRSHRLGHDLPELRALPDIARFAQGMQQEQSAHEELRARARANEAVVPEHAASARAAVESLMAMLRRASGSGMHEAGDLASPSTAFVPSVVAAHGGPTDFDLRWTAFLQAFHNVSGRLVAVDAGGVVAHVALDVQRPRPDGSGVGHMVAYAGDWWSTSADDVRRDASERLSVDDMREHEFNLNVLLVRGDDQQWRIADDVLAILEELSGDFESLVRSGRR